VVSIVIGVMACSFCSVTVVILWPILSIVLMYGGIRSRCISVAAPHWSSPFSVCLHFPFLVAAVVIIL